MNSRKLYNHIIFTDFMGIRTKIKNFVKTKRTKIEKNEKI